MTPSPQPVAGKTERNPGIELLRAIAMLMVIVLHIVVHGGFFDKLGLNSPSYFLTWLLYAITTCSVNCYALISGYVGIYSRHRYSSLALTWLQVVFYLLLGNLGLYLAFPGHLSIRWPLISFVPVLTNQYWYFTAYFALFFFMPYLDSMIHALNKKQGLCLLGCIFMFFSLLPTLRGHAVYSLNFGYSILWLMVLYVVGGVLRKHELLQKCRRWVWAVVFLLSIALGYGAKIALAAGWIPLLSARFSSTFLLTYTSPVMLLAAVALLGFFSEKTTMSGFWAKLATLLGSASFGIYLLHTQPLLISNFLGNRFAPLVSRSAPEIIGIVFAAALGIFLLGTAVDLLRQQLFKLLRLKPLLEKLENRIFSKNK